ncbi:TPA: fimbrial assembly protein, partial [Escherichia coli]
KETLVLAPWSEQTITTSSVVSQYNVTLIDDHGNYLSEKVKAVK